MGRITINDMDSLKSISDLKISPDGSMLAFCLKSTCLKENRYRSFLCTYDLENGSLLRLTGSDQVSSFCFDQEGMLVYTGGCAESGGEAPGNTKDMEAPGGTEDVEAPGNTEYMEAAGSTEFWRADPRSGSAARAFALPLADAEINLLSGSRFIICAPWDLELEKLRASGDAQAVRAHLDGEVIVCDEYPYRIDGQGYVNKRRKRIYEYDSADGSLRAVTPPTFQTRDYTTDGGTLYVLGEDYSVRSAKKHSVYCWDGETFRLRAACGCMLSALAAAGGRIYASTDMLPDEMDSYLYTADLRDGELRAEIKTRYSLFNNISTDGAGGSGREFAALDESLYYTAQNRNGVFLYRYAGGCETRISPKGVDILHFAVAPDGRIFAAGLPEFGSPEVYEIKPDEAVKLTSFTDAELGAFDFVKPEHLVFTGSDGCEIDGWVVPPADYRPDRTYPAILNIHGGPQLRFFGGFNFTHQLWAAGGYYVMYCNPHGSIGDTADFSDLRKKYGTIDYEDIMTFVDTVLSRYPSIDEKRMGITGISYGGFMTNWIITRNHRFAAAASQSGISDWISLHATDDLPGFDLTITGSLPWENIGEHWRISPLAYAGECRTPTLFIECGEDYRCPVDQGLGMYQALLELGVPSRAVILNGETHCVFRLGKPLSRLRIFREIMEWFETYIPGE